MDVDRRAVLALRAFLLVLFAVLVLLQVFSMPGQFAYMARQEPDLAWLRWPLTVVAALLLLCVQAVVVATWRLLSLVQADRIFSPDAFRWVDAILVAVASAEVLLVGCAVLVALEADDPALPLLVFLALVGVAVVGLLMVVMRALLHQATGLRLDLEGVV